MRRNQLVDSFSTASSLQEDPLQDLTLFLEGKLLLYQRSLKKITEPNLLQSVVSVDTKPNPRLAKFAHTQSAVLTSETSEPVAPVTIISSLQSKRTELQQVNVRPQFQSYVRQLPDALEWEELFAMIADGEVLWELFNCKVIKVSTTIVVKVGRGVDRFRDEVALMEFVKQSTSIPIPEVFGFHHNEDVECFIFMSYIEGCTLESSWPSLRLEDRKTIESQLAGYFAELRSLPSPNPVTSAHWGRVSVVMLAEWNENVNLLVPNVISMNSLGISLFAGIQNSLECSYPVSKIITESSSLTATCNLEIFLYRETESLESLIGS